MAGSTSLADRLRQHRLAFELALKLGCTPKEAEIEMRRRAAVERDQQASARLAAKLAKPMPIATRNITHGDEPQQPWWNRD